MEPATDVPPGAAVPGADRSALVVLGLAVAGLVGFGAYLWSLPTPWSPEVGFGAQVLAVPRKLPDFALVDHRGRPFGHARLEGRWSLLYFGTTSCPDVCPATLQILAALGEYADAAPPVQRVFVSVDPLRDTPARLAAYVGYFDPQLLGVAGPLPEIGRLTRAVGAMHQRGRAVGGSRSYRVDHAASLFLVDPQARLYAILDEPVNADAFADLVRKVQALPPNAS